MTVHPFPKSNLPAVEPREVIAMALSVTLGREFGPHSLPVDLTMRALKAAGWKFTPRSGAEVVSIEAAMKEIVIKKETALLDHVVELLGRNKSTRGLNQHAATGGNRDLPARHDGPLHVQRSAAITFIRGQPQMISEHRKGREREMLCQDDAYAQRSPRSGQRCVRFLRTALLSH